MVDLYDGYVKSIPKVDDEMIWDLKRFGGAFLALELATILMQTKLADTWRGAFFGLLPLIIMNVVAGLILFQTWLHYRKLISIRQISKDPKVMKAREDIKEATKGNDYLTDLIDNI